MNNFKGNATSMGSRRAIVFITLFLFLYALLYVTNYALTGLIQPGGYYSEWLNTHFDYVTLFRQFLLKSTAKVIGWFSYETAITGNILWVKGGHNIRMVYSCMGLNLLFVWWAFVIAFPMAIKRKLFLFIAGTASLVSLNIIRLSAITMSPQTFVYKEWAVNHHTLFNGVAYVLIFFAIRQTIKRMPFDKK